MTYACPVWGCAATSNLQKLSAIPKYISKEETLNAPWFNPNTRFRRELKVPSRSDHMNTNSPNFFPKPHTSPCSLIFSLGLQCCIPTY